ncbi:MAG TPA: endonuclease III, partial [Candidatus Hodarchaeales archaeon]|nr:endonuclease III [Candidatus Hodarchaeales archaeon]
TDIDSIIKILRREVVHYKVPVVDLIQVQTKDPFKVLVATILSARTKDETTAVVCKRLFGKVGKLEDLEHVSEAELRELIYPVGFYKTKAKHLKELPALMKEEFDGNVPHEIDDLLKLPGVGRKTANLVRAVAFEKPAICVDVHVWRISNRLGYVRTKTPHETEIALRKKLPEKYWTTFNTMLVAFGQNICRPVSPKCSECPINQYCKKIGVTSTR